MYYTNIQHYENLIAHYRNKTANKDRHMTTLVECAVSRLVNRIVRNSSMQTTMMLNNRSA